MDTEYELEPDQELPVLELVWRDGNRQFIDFSSGWTFTARIVTLDRRQVWTKSTGFVGGAGGWNLDGTPIPNLSMEWATGDLVGLRGSYDLLITARRSGDSKDRPFRPIRIRVKAPVTI